MNEKTSHEPMRTKGELLTKRSELERAITKIQRQLDTEMNFPAGRARLERQQSRLVEERLQIDKMLDEHSGQTTLF